MHQDEYKKAIRAKDIVILNLENKICEMELQILKEKIKHDDFWRMPWYKRLLHSLLGEN